MRPVILTLLMNTLQMQTTICDHRDDGRAGGIFNSYEIVKVTSRGSVAHVLHASLPSWCRLREWSAPRCGRGTAIGGKRWVGGGGGLGCSAMSMCALLCLRWLKKTITQQMREGCSMVWAVFGCLGGLSPPSLLYSLSHSSLLCTSLSPLLLPIPLSPFLSPHSSPRALVLLGSPFLHHIIFNGFDERHAYIGGMFGAGMASTQHTAPHVTCTTSHTHHMYTHTTCTHTTHVHTHHMYTHITCTHTSHVHIHHMYTYITCTHTPHVHTHHMYTHITCTHTHHTYTHRYLFCRELL